MKNNFDPYIKPPTRDYGSPMELKRAQEGAEERAQEKKPDSMESLLRRISIEDFRDKTYFRLEIINQLSKIKEQIMKQRDLNELPCDAKEDEESYDNIVYALSNTYDEIEEILHNFKIGNKKTSLEKIVKGLSDDEDKYNIILSGIINFIKEQVKDDLILSEFKNLGLDIKADEVAIE